MTEAMDHERTEHQTSDRFSGQPQQRRPDRANAKEPLVRELQGEETLMTDEAAHPGPLNHL